MDTGPGITMADRAHLFDRFYRGLQATQSNKPGTGLGLSIVQEVVDLHGGWIEVDSVEGKGSTFTVWLPLAEV
jgi:signal transduction histidine kinase